MPLDHQLAGARDVAKLRERVGVEIIPQAGDLSETSVRSFITYCELCILVERDVLRFEDR